MSVSARRKQDANLQSQSQAVGPLLPQMLLALLEIAPGQSSQHHASAQLGALLVAACKKLTGAQNRVGQVRKPSLQVPGRGAAAMSRLAWVVPKGWQGLLAAVHVTSEVSAPLVAAAGRTVAEGTAAGDTGAVLPKDLPTTCLKTAYGFLIGRTS